MAAVMLSDNQAVMNLFNEKIKDIDKIGNIVASGAVFVCVMNNGDVGKVYIHRRKLNHSGIDLFPCSSEQGWTVEKQMSRYYVYSLVVRN